MKAAPTLPLDFKASEKRLISTSSAGRTVGAWLARLQEQGEAGGGRVASTASRGARKGYRLIYSSKQEVEWRRKLASSPLNSFIDVAKKHNAQIQPKMC